MVRGDKRGTTEQRKDRRGKWRVNTQHTNMIIMEMCGVQENDGEVCVCV